MPEQSEPDHQPHDKLFRASFGDPVTAAGFLEGQLPEELSRLVRWRELKLESGSFIDSRFRKSESDLLFSAPVEGGASCFVYLLFEHQRRKDRWMALRLLRYMVRIWENFLKEHKEAERLPVILPVVLAQNARTWDIRPDFKSLLDLPPQATGDLTAFCPDFLFRLVQLAELPFDKIAGTPAGILTLRVMKAERTGDLLRDEVWDGALMAQLPRDLLEWILRYIYGGGIDTEAFEDRIESVEPQEIKEFAMTLAQQYEEKGLQKGLQKGIAVGELCGQIRICQELLGLELTPESELLKLPIEELGKRAETLKRRLKKG